MTKQDQELIIASQAALIKALSIYPAYNIMTRTGLEQMVWPRIVEMATYVIYADVDDMHQLNDRYGWDEVNRRIENALHSRTMIGSNRAPDVGRWFSGDELLWIICEGNPLGLANSIQTAMRAQGFSATFGIAPITSPMLSENVKTAMDLVHVAKQAGLRGSISRSVTTKDQSL